MKHPHARRHRPARQVRRTLTATVAVVAGFGLTAHTVHAAECGEAAEQGVFYPGTWLGSGADSVSSRDRIAELFLDREGQFNVIVGADGVVKSGALVYEAIGANVMRIDRGHSRAAWTVEAELSGVGSSVDAIGTFDMEIDGIVDVAGADGTSNYGPTLFGFGGGTGNEIHFELVPEAQDCTMAFGYFDLARKPAGEVAIGTGGGGLFEPLAWVAVRSNVPRPREVLDRFVEVVRDAQEFRMRDTFDIEELTSVVHDLIALNSLLASASDCSMPKNLRAGSPTAKFARYTLFQVIADFLDSALGGNYSTPDVIRAFSLAIESGSFYPDACMGETGEARANAIHKFHRVLRDRLERAQQGSDFVEIELIVATAYQYGFYDLTEA